MSDRIFREIVPITRARLERVQINLGDRCNQACSHCHIAASPQGERVMSLSTAERIIGKLLGTDIGEIELTGGTPELSPALPLFIEELSVSGRRVSVRTSLTILDSPEHRGFIDLYRRHGVRVIASLPGLSDEADRQRGKGAFERSVRVMRMLNERGYGGEGLDLDIVCNPLGASLPPPQEVLEGEYRGRLRNDHGVSFTSLVTIVNSPVGRFRDSLLRSGGYSSYMKLLTDSFNPATLDCVMCRSLLSVDYQGEIYDCDFNLALGLWIKGHEGRKLWETDLDDFSPEISCGEHCYACTVGRGSSCHGVLLRGADCSPVKRGMRIMTQGCGSGPET